MTREAGERDMDELGLGLGFLRRETERRDDEGEVRERYEIGRAHV